LYIGYLLRFNAFYVLLDSSIRNTLFRYLNFLETYHTTVNIDSRKPNVTSRKGDTELWYS